jgi:hypothetical protein
MARKSPNESGPVWPRHLREYSPERDGWDCKLSWYWARLDANRDQGLGFDPLLLLQDVTAATVNPDCNPYITQRQDDDDA